MMKTQANEESIYQIRFVIVSVTKLVITTTSLARIIYLELLSGTPPETGS